MLLRNGCSLNPWAWKDKNSYLNSLFSTHRKKKQLVRTVIGTSEELRSYCCVCQGLSLYFSIDRITYSFQLRFAVLLGSRYRSPLSYGAQKQWFITQADNGGQVPFCVHDIQDNRLCLYEPHFLNCTFNRRRKRQGLGVTEEVTRFFSDFSHSTEVCWAPSTMACATYKGTENMSLLPRSLLLGRERNSHNYSSSCGLGQGFVKPALWFDFLCLICFLTSPVGRCGSLTNILEARLFQRQLWKDPPWDIQQGESVAFQGHSSDKTVPITS